MTTPPPGLYERVWTARLADELDGQALVRELAEIDPAEAHIVLARHLHAVVERALRSVPASERPAAQVAVANRMLDVVADSLRAGVDASDHVSSSVLRSLTAPAAGLGATTPPGRPGIPLAESALLVNARGERRIGAELARELDSADRVDLLLSFLKWSGYVQIRGRLQAFLESGRRLRVLTTVYLGATDRKVLDELVGRGAAVRVSYDTKQTRLHAKAWLFHRESGFSTAYIGSSNLSAPALTAGLEWNVRLSEVETPRVVQKFRATFDSYWRSDEFEGYETARDAARFDAAVRSERRDDGADTVLGVDVRPYPFQQVILQRLDAERRVHGRARNLVIAATGTGKTVIAALDYARERRLAGGALTLLFVAHRKEILQQSRLMFRQVLRDGGFGELLVDGLQPADGRYVFASVQSLARVDLETWDPGHYDVVIVDEFHHAQAPTYRRLLEFVRPKILLGLTATPERADGQSVLTWFGGHVAAELRLWDAIDRGLLAPFQYFGVHDGVSVAQAWKRGRFDAAALEGLYTGHHARARLIINAVVDHVARVDKMRAIGFCVGVGHARFMADQFTAAGIGAVALTGQTASAERRDAVSRLRTGALQVLFTVDLFNEGVDIPEVDTVLFLRPTESATVFLQQLGRGLRRCPGKDALTVLDFIGETHARFRFDLRYRAMTGASRRQVAAWVRDDFPVLPAGCSLQLDRSSQEVVLDNLKHAVGHDRRALLAELKRLGDVSLETFLREAQVDLADVYRGGRTFSDLRRAAGLWVAPAGPDEDALGRALGRLIHVNDASRLGTWRAALAGERSLSVGQAREAAMLAVILCGRAGVADPLRALDVLRAHPAVHAELTALVDALGDRIQCVSYPLDDALSVPLRVHGRYRLQEIMAAFDARGRSPSTSAELYVPREGVWFDPVSRCNAMFVTLQKSESDYSPSTMYEDYALSSTEFHWQSQSRTSPESEKGRRHVKHVELGVTPLLFVRQSRRDSRGETAAYTLLGPARRLRWSGSRPMTVVWGLDRPMPAAQWLRSRLTG